MCPRNMQDVPRLSLDIPNSEKNLQQLLCMAKRTYIPDNSMLPLQVSTADPVADFKQILEGGQVAQAVQGMIDCILRLLDTSMGR